MDIGDQEFPLRKDAKLSKCRKYRFALWRIWNDAKPNVLFIGLNPSIADEEVDDPTLIRCIDYAKSWGYGGVCVANLFAYRATEIKDMLKASEPVGFHNDQWLIELADKADLVIAAWGNNGVHMERSRQVRALLPNLYCLKVNKSGEPAHPLYQKADLQPIPLCTSK